MKANSTQKIVEYIQNSLSANEKRELCAELELDTRLRAKEAGLRKVLGAEKLAARTTAELSENFEDVVMRRVRVAPPPQALQDSSFLRIIVEAFFHPTRMQATAISTCVFVFILALSPDWRRGTVGQESVGKVRSLSLYDSTRNESFARIINAVTARIPEGFRAVSLEATGWAYPGEHVDVMWLAEMDSKSVSAIVVHNARVLSNERELSGNDDEVIRSTVTLLIPAEDAAKLELARATGTIALSARDSAPKEENPIEEFILKGGNLIPKA